jgi:5-formyltetrahydrofolate cyclo-ligase
MNSRTTLRRDMRRRRRALSDSERQHLAHAALRQLKTMVKLRRGMRIAVYLATDGELDTAPLIEYARERGCEIYVPVIRRYSPRSNLGKTSATMWFVRLRGALRANRFGILEPLHDARERIDPRWLDIVLAPVVAFGQHGERLGSGAGFYDQTFSFLRHRRRWKKPQLIGLAYHWQASDAVANAAWDVPLSAIVTDTEAHRFVSEGG